MPTLEETRDCIDIAVKAMEFVKEELKKDGYQFPGEEQTLPKSQKDEESPIQESNNQ